MGMSPSAIAAEVGIPRATVYRIKDDPAKAVALLETWGIAKGRGGPDRVEINAACG